jgi:hypothetical protein
MVVFFATKTPKHQNQQNLSKLIFIENINIFYNFRPECPILEALLFLVLFRVLVLWWLTFLKLSKDNK